MKVKDLKEKLEKIGAADDELEVRVSPLVLMDAVSTDGRQRRKTETASPDRIYGVKAVLKIGTLEGAEDPEFCLVFGYDESVNFGNAEENQSGEDMNEYIN